jgi:glycosyl transferase family 2
MAAVPIATVLVPAHNHGPLLLYAVTTALRQTVRELEVLIVGDGADEATRDAAIQLQRLDERVRFFENPKGPRHGEVHRHAALHEARGRIVCYLADDDLWFPEHVEVMAGLLETADFVHALPVWIEVDGLARVGLGHLKGSGIRERMEQGWNFIPLSCAAHTMALYRRLPFGWRTSPPDVWTDLHMFRQILAVPDCRAESGSRMTVLHFPSPPRHDWTMTQRVAELASWSQRLSDPNLERLLGTQVIDYLLRTFVERDWGAIYLENVGRAVQARATALATDLAARETDLAARETDLVALATDLAARGERLAALQERCGDLEARTVALATDLAARGERLAALRGRCDDLEACVREREEELAAVRRTATWRLHERLVRHRWLVAAVQRLTRRGSGREGQ